MYNCSICSKEVIVDGINKPKCCEWAKILAGMTSGLHGTSTMEVRENNNLSNEIAPIFSQVCQLLIAKEIFANKKNNVYVKDFKITDTETNRTFTVTLDIW